VQNLGRLRATPARNCANVANCLALLRGIMLQQPQASRAPNLPYLLLRISRLSRSVDAPDFKGCQKAGADCVLVAGDQEFKCVPRFLIVGIECWA
jgi:hypothetical protein